MAERREHQVKTVDALPGLLKAHGSVCMVSPTGSGKTVILAKHVRGMPALLAMMTATSVRKSDAT